MRVAGCDPGTSSLDILVLQDGAVVDQVRIEPEELRKDPDSPLRFLRDTGPFDLIAGPSGYGLPLIRARDCTDAQLDLMSLVRPEERGRAQGIAGFSALLRAFRDSQLPVVFLPGVIHLPTVPVHRKLNRIDLGTPDKLCVAAMVAAQHQSDEPACAVEFGSAFTALVVIHKGEIIDGMGGTFGPYGAQSGGLWDGETAYLLSPLEKADLFRGGVADAPDREIGKRAFRESFCKMIYGLLNVHGFQDIYLSGRLLDTDSELVREAVGELPSSFFRTQFVAAFPNGWMKRAAHGAALIADGLAGGRYSHIVDRLRIREAKGSVLDWILHPRIKDVRSQFGLESRTPLPIDPGSS